MALAPLLCDAQSDSAWNSRFQACKAALEKGELAIAEQQCDAAVKEGSQFGASDLRFGIALAGMASVRLAQKRYAEARPLYVQGLAVLERIAGADHPNLLETQSDLAEVDVKLGRYDEAETILRKVAAAREKISGPRSVEAARALSNLGLVQEALGRLDQAEQAYQRALSIAEAARGPNDPDVASIVTNLANVLDLQGRPAQARALWQRVLEAPGIEEITTVNALNNMALLYDKEGRFEESERLYRRALALAERLPGTEDRQAAIAMNLANLYGNHRRYADAEPLYRRAITLDEKAFGAETPRLGKTFHNMSLLYDRLGRLPEARSFAQRALSLFERLGGPSHPDVAAALVNLAFIEQAQGRHADALAAIRRASAIGATRREGSRIERADRALAEQRTYAYRYAAHVRIVADALESGAISRPAASAEAFLAAQAARLTATAGVVTRMAVRFATGNDELAAVVRRRQDLAARLETLDQDLLSALSRRAAERDSAKERALRHDIEEAQENLARIDASLRARFPAFATLTNPAPVALSEIQGLLRENEALVSYLVTDKQTFVWAARKDAAVFVKLEVSRADLDRAVQRLRTQVDASDGRLKRFDLAAAHRLYQRVFAPVEAVLTGASHVIVVPDGALASLPFALLVSAAPSSHADEYRTYRDAPWLGKRYAFSYLPAESSLAAMRRLARESFATEPFTGFGDPLLGGGSGRRGARADKLFTRAGVADVRMVKQLQRLPETADELIAMARILRADPAAVHLRDAATETAVKRTDLSRYRVIAFATHGLVAGDFDEVGEPALVLTPPVSGTEVDDGLLTASEVARLKLDADWVILSACNTASDDGTADAEGLSGLAKAFFFAGSRSLLVSHWPVDSESTVKLTTRMLAETTADAAIGKAEALRRSMMTLMADDTATMHAHPAFWAPFVVVGEGGVRSR